MKISKVTPRKFDRLFEFDPIMHAMPIRALVMGAKPRSYTWSISVTLDQGSEGACVGFAWAHELIARPVIVKNVDAAYAHDKIYVVARTLDQWPGENYEGTSVVAGAKAVEKLGLLKEFRWALDVDDLILAIGHAGPAVLGINWFDGMMAVNHDGMIAPTGAMVGGHAILCNAVDVVKRTFTLHNSWGPGWGDNGNAKITFEDMKMLLGQQGEAAIPVRRGQVAPVSVPALVHGNTPTARK